jgi:hypothetical protein
VGRGQGESGECREKGGGACLCTFCLEPDILGTCSSTVNLLLLLQVYHNGSVVWSPPTDTPVEYGDPLPMETVRVGYVHSLCHERRVFSREAYLLYACKRQFTTLALPSPFSYHFLCASAHELQHSTVLGVHECMCAVFKTCMLAPPFTGMVASTRHPAARPHSQKQPPGTSAATLPLWSWMVR